MEKVLIKQHPDKQIENNIPFELPEATWIVSYKTTFFIDGKYVLKFKTSLQIRNDTEQQPSFTHSMYMRFGFLPPNTKDSFYEVAYRCYQMAVIEFNKSLDDIKSKNPYPDAHFQSLEQIKKLVDVALNPQVN